MVNTPIGTNSPNYMLQPTDVGATIFCRVTATNASGSAQAFSNAVGPVVAAGGDTLPVNAGGADLPAITPTTTVEGTLYTTTNGTWTGSPSPTFTRQWKSDAANVGTGLTTYTTVAGDVGKTITCVVTATNTVGAVNATSNSVGPVTAAGGGGLPASVQAAGSDTFTTAAINTTGAGLLIVGASSYGSVPVITDSKGNTWNEIVDPQKVTIFWCRPTTVGAGHTVTATGTGFYCGLTFAAFDYAAIASPVDATIVGSGDTSALASLIGTLTPTQNNELIIIAGGNLGGAGEEFTTITGGFTMFPSIPAASGVNLGHRMAYLLQTTAAAADPDWTLSTSVQWGLSAASFKNA